MDHYDKQRFAKSFRRVTNAAEMRPYVSFKTNLNGQYSKCGRYVLKVYKDEQDAIRETMYYIEPVHGVGTRNALPRRRDGSGLESTPPERSSSSRRTPTSTRPALEDRRPATGGEAHHTGVEQPSSSTAAADTSSSQPGATELAFQERRSSFAHSQVVVGTLPPALVRG